MEMEESSGLGFNVIPFSPCVLGILGAAEWGKGRNHSCLCMESRLQGKAGSPVRRWASAAGGCVTTQELVGLSEP